MKARAKRSRSRTKTARVANPVKPRARSAKRAPAGELSSSLAKVLSLIKAHPGIRPSELNRALHLDQSDGLRNALIKRGLIRKEKDGSAMRYYAV